MQKKKCFPYTDPSTFSLCFFSLFNSYPDGVGPVKVPTLIIITVPLTLFPSCLLLLAPLTTSTVSLCSFYFCRLTWRMSAQTKHMTEHEDSTHQIVWHMLTYVTYTDWRMLTYAYKSSRICHFRRQSRLFRRQSRTSPLPTAISSGDPYLHTATYVSIRLHTSAYVRPVPHRFRRQSRAGQGPLI